MSAVAIKICGLTNLRDARLCLDLGADFLGLNFWSGSPRRCAWDAAKEVVELARSFSVPVVGVFVNATAEELRRHRRDLGLDLLQLHGDESSELLEAFQPSAFRAVRVRDSNDLPLALDSAGPYVLLDAFVAGEYGGTGRCFRWHLAREVSERRRVLVAGGLRPENVEEAIQEARPFGVDVASGVEQSPGRKDPELLRAFFAAARKP